MSSIKAWVAMVCLIAMAQSSSPVSAGDLSPAAPPDDANSRMFTLEDIYQRLSTGANDDKSAGSFTQPADGPTAGTMHTTDEVMAVAPAPDDANGATAAQVLSGKTFWGLIPDEDGEETWGQKGGTMENNGSVILTPSTENQAIAEGYHDGNGYVEGDGNLKSEYIKNGVQIFGCTGSLETGGNVAECGECTGATECTKNCTCVSATEAGPGRCVLTSRLIENLLNNTFTAWGSNDAACRVTFESKKNFDDIFSCTYDGDTHWTIYLLY